ncbi:MAG: zinc ribbon domain-containing protein [Bacteroidetes bacterium]|nr:zinc ribbon domain-containing protein [Bacteroidota bacterium]MCL1968389.1 zinc ribbon domain-containing protein [Bacteroidota bacterium]
MKKLVFILICISICAMACKPKTTSQENQTQNSTEFADMAICQSCAMPLTEDLYGTNADGTLNPEYCKYCYTDGKFVAPDLTKKEMIEICVPYMVEQGMPEGNARILLQEYLPKLKRWQTQEEIAYQ